jgi:pyruvate/2-oxoglutarate dehydrogenase complex dihydrolipoamide acyltransferase (E2) component
MAIPIKIPDVGVNVNSVVFLKWLKQPGDMVKRGDPLCEVETDKAATEIESVAQGTLLKQLVSSGTEVEIGAVIAYVGQPGEATP